MPSGGKREGSGRPKANTKAVLFRLTQDQEKQVRDFVKKIRQDIK
jgi:hypothetical protein